MKNNAPSVCASKDVDVTSMGSITGEQRCLKKRCKRTVGGLCIGQQQFDAERKATSRAGRGLLWLFKLEYGEMLRAGATAWR